MKPTIGRHVYFAYKGDERPMAAIVSDVPDTGDYSAKSLPEGAICWIHVTYFWHTGGATGWTWIPFFETEEAWRSSRRRWRTAACSIRTLLLTFFYRVERRNDFPSELHLVELPFGVDRPAETAWATRTFYESAREIGLQKNARDVYRRGPCTTASS